MNKIKTGVIDKVFSLAVREANWYVCESCGRQSFNRENGYMDNAHQFSRRYQLIRFDPRNTACLCRKCHMFYTVNPHDHVKFFMRLKGDDYYIMEQLRHEKYKLTRSDRDEIHDHYIEEILRIGKMRMDGYIGKIELHIPEVLL